MSWYTAVHSSSTVPSTSCLHLHTHVHSLHPGGATTESSGQPPYACGSPPRTAKTLGEKVRRMIDGAWWPSWRQTTKWQIGKLPFFSCSLCPSMSSFERRVRDFRAAGCMPSMECRTWETCLLYTSPSPRDQRGSRMPSSA